MSAPANEIPPRIGEVFLKLEPEKLTLTPRPKSVATNAIIYAALAVYFTYRAIVMGMEGQWFWMAIYIVFVITDVLAFLYQLNKKDERLVIDRGGNRIQGRTDATAAMVSEVQRVQVVNNTFSLIANGQEVRPSLPLTTLRDKAEARWLGQIVADFIGVPMQVMS